MKKLYMILGLFFLTMGSLSYVISYHPPYGSVHANWLSNNKDKWSLEMEEEPNKNFSKKLLKERLIIFIDRLKGIEHKLATSDGNWMLIISILCMIGYYRERKMKQLTSNKS